MSRDSLGRHPTISPQPWPAMSDTGLVKVDSVSSENRKIRFAPLPEIRPRRYSTGRGIWVEDGDEDEDGELGENPGERRQSIDLDDGLDDSDDDENGRTSSMFGSWKSESGSFGGRSRSDDDGAGSSYTAKLLRPLSFGLGKKSKKSGRPSTSDGSSGRSESLSRVSSNESDVSRGSSMEASSFRPTGIPMRKTRTWESGDSASPRESRRANYPPVAQRSRTARRPAPVSVSAPAFVEWGAGGSLGSNQRQVEDEDDGSGSAWIKKRRQQREQAAAEKKKQEEEEAAAAALAAEEAENGGGDAEEGDDDDLDPTLPFDDMDGGSGSGAATPRVAQELSKSTAIDAIAPASSASTTPKQVSSLSMTRPSLNLVTASPASSPAVGSKPFDFPKIDPTPTLNSPTTFTDEGDADGDSSDEDEDEDDNDDDDDDSDLDEDELAQEEALAEQARITAKSAGTEKYHSASHHASVVTPTAPRSGVSTPVRQSTVSSEKTITHN